MSAWIVTQGHIDTLILGGIQLGLIQPTHDLNELGHDLWRENHRSVGYRYGEAYNLPAYHYTPRETRLNLAGLVKQLGCFDYQSCEHEGWSTSRARFYCEALEALALRELGLPDVGALADSPAYRDAPWGVDSPEEIEAFA